MAIERARAEQDGNCWVFNYGPGSEADQAHYKTPQEALADLAARAIPAGGVLGQMPGPCFVARCDSCGTPDGWHGEGTTHFEAGTLDELRGLLGDLQVTEAGQLLCDWCAEDLSKAAEAAVRRLAL
ncbi:hypothetical protein [Kribbella solani]|uniref:Uncharacterized protein n=1 Tax=Kribbella solani TaxID=236067 RepID=A0A841E0K7_9ACTN|nr:hypothetical protein [Kribbella solani]MBB5983979.1 hypothetical protein [Kribbella solani]